MDQRTPSAATGTPTVSTPADRRMGVTTAAGATQPRLRLPDDPGLAGLRRAARAALVVPAAFAFAKLVIGDSQVTTFVAFGCFALLVMSDFGGTRRPRAAAYVTATLVGAALLTLGTLVSPVAWVAALVMLLVGFWVQFSGVFGSYVAAAQTGLLLAFVLAVSVPAPPAAVGARLAGWLLAGAVSTLAGVFLWPRFERVALRRKAAAACRSLAELVRAQRGMPGHVDLSQQRQTAAVAVETVRREYGATPKRPAGPTRRDRAFVELLTELERTLEFVTRPFYRQPSTPHPRIEEGDRLTAAVVRTLEASADVLTEGAPPDLLGLEEARLAHRQALDRWAADALQDGRSPEDVLAGLDADHTLRVVSYLALAVGSNAVIAAGGQVARELPLPAGTPRKGTTRVVLRVARTIRTHLVPTSSVLHNSLRVGVGLALAVLLARLLRLDHAFWVVLGTLSVLRSNALATGRTTIQALTGTVAGFAVGALFTAIVGASSPVLWAALPVTVFLAAYATSAIGFVVGQAAFTVNLIILFNLISPVGWRIGLARIEDVAVGAGISVVVGLLLWPRGARGELGLAVAGLYRAVAAFLASSFNRLLELGSPEDAGQMRSLAVQARDRADEAFDQFLNERGAKPLDPRTAAFLVASGAHAITAGDAINVVADLGYQAGGCVDGARALRAQMQAMVATFVQLADRLGSATGGAGPQVRVSDNVLHEAALTCLHRWKEDPAGGRAAIAVVAAGEWIEQLGALAADLEEPVAAAVKGARTAWWR